MYRYHIYHRKRRRDDLLQPHLASVWQERAAVVGMAEFLRGSSDTFPTLSLAARAGSINMNPFGTSEGEVD